MKAVRDDTIVRVIELLAEAAHPTVQFKTVLAVIQELNESRTVPEDVFCESSDKCESTSSPLPTQALNGE